MAKDRDDLSKATIEILAKRVGYICSNPNCKQLTVGANENENKYQAHIFLECHVKR